MYQVLYRKWRPRVFEDVVGQPQVTSTLLNELKTGRISHAYLFTGTRGTGKTTCAKILAKAVNCLSPQNGDPCGKCEICRAIDEGAVMDISEIDAASNNGVDNIRDLRDEANYTPSICKYRVFIIDEVHMLSISAFNALLKTLEEPPEHVIFILATTEINKLPATILSRCQRFDFRRIPPEDIAKRLIYITEQEGGTLKEEAAMMIAELSDGALRDAVSLLDQCMGISKDIDEDIVQSAAGVAGSEFLFRIADGVINKDIVAALETVDELYSGAKDIERICGEVCMHFRALMIMKVTTNPQKILTQNKAQIEKLKKQADKTTLSFILRCLDTISEAGEKMGRSRNKKTELEMALIRLGTNELDTSSEALLRRIEALENIISNKSGAVTLKSEAKKVEKAVEKRTPEVESEPQRIYEEPPFEEQVVEKAPEVKKPSVRPTEAFKESDNAGALEEPSGKNAEKFHQWADVLQIMKGYSQSVAAAFAGSNAYISGGYILISAPNKMAFELLRKPSQRDKMRDAIQQVTGRRYNLGPYKKDEEKTEKSDDTLADFVKKAESMGIDVKLN